jgi:RHS repeat-associated protein
MLAEYIYLGDQLLAMIKPGEAVYYFHNDHLGTPQVLTDDTGTIAWKAAYTPFGEAIASIQTVENPFRFPGQYYDSETGLHYNYFRYYNPQTGRYMTPDPIGLEGGINLFAYVGNNPASWVDRMGLDVVIVINRGPQTSVGTPGKFSVFSTSDPSFLYTGYTFEPPSGGNKPKIAAGTYYAFQRYKSKTGEIYNPPRIELKKAKSEACGAMTGAQLHIGNTIFQTEGCILVGQLPSMEGQPNTIGDSTTALKWINAIINTDRGKNITVIIYD